MSIQELIDNQDLINKWKQFENEKSQFENITSKLKQTINQIEENEKYIELADSEEKDLVDSYKVKTKDL